jgi:hypothetical protein
LISKSVDVNEFAVLITFKRPKEYARCAKERLLTAAPSQCRKMTAKTKFINDKAYFFEQIVRPGPPYYHVSRVPLQQQNLTLHLQEIPIVHMRQTQAPEGT